MGHRVVVTGYGTVCAAALDSTGFRAALKEGRRCFSELSKKWAVLSGLNATHAGIIGDLKEDTSDPSEILSLDRNVQLALRSLREALAIAGLTGTFLGERAALVLGTCSGGMLSTERHYRDLASGIDSADRNLVFSKRYYTTAKVLAWAAQSTGPTLTVVTACAAGAGAIAQGADLIRAGLVDIALCGGSDAFAPSTLVGFDALKATCAGLCSPFSSNIGLNLGEGSAFLVLESLRHAEKRHTEIYSELLGYGLSNDAYHPTAPDPSTKGQVAAMKRALKDGGKTPGDIDYVNAHGTGTRANDPAESKAIGKVLEDHALSVPVSSTKSIIGHCLGGAGTLEASAAILAAKGGFFPSTAGFDKPRDGCRLPDYVPDPGRPWKGRIALTNSFGFAGNNASLLLDMGPIEKSSQSIKKPVGFRRSDSTAVITGSGVITAAGIGLENLQESRSYIRELDRFTPPTTPFPVGQVSELDPKIVGKRLDLKGMDLCSKFATLAVRSALVDSNIQMRPAVLADVGMILGLATGPSKGESEHLQAVFENDFRIESLGAFPFVVQNEVAGHVARSLMLRGHNTVLSTGHGAGLAAVISSAIAVEQGHADIIVAAASDEIGRRPLLDAFMIGEIGPQTDVIPGEGAGALVVESRSSASARKSQIIAEILGYDLATEIETIRYFSGKSLEQSVARALTRADVRPHQIDCVTFSNSGTPASLEERNAVKTIFSHPGVIFHSLAPQIGFLEASLPIVNLAYILKNSPENTLACSVSLSQEGLCNVVVLRTTPKAQ